MKSPVVHLFTPDYEQRTPAAEELSKKLREAVEPILQDIADKGFSMRDAKLIALSEIDMLSACIILRRNIGRKKK